VVKLIEPEITGLPWLSVRPVRVTVYVVSLLRPVMITVIVPSAGIVVDESETVPLGLLDPAAITTTALFDIEIGNRPPFVICSVALLLVTSSIVMVADSEVGMCVFVPEPMRPDTHP